MSAESEDPGATPWQTVGPFFHVGLAMCASDSARDAASQAPIRLRIRVTDGDRRPVPDAVVEIWQVAARESGAPPPHTSDTGTAAGFGRLPTDEDGACEFDTVRPHRNTRENAGARAAHISVCLMARGLLRPLYTQLYFADDPALAADAVLALVPATRRQTLVAQPDADDPMRWVFEVRLQGEGETVFFDV